MDTGKIFQIRNFTLFLPHQKKVFSILIGLLVLVVSFFYVASFLVGEPKSIDVPTLEDYSQCRSSFCYVMRNVGKNPDNIIYNTYLITFNNIRTEIYYIFESKYIFFGPIINIFDLGSFIGVNLFYEPIRTVSEILLPHGIFEIVASLLLISLYYSMIVNIFRMFLKRKAIYILKPFGIQITIVIILFILAGMLESIAIAMK